ncbi:hypothetical protein LguiA_003534 [Lonicera macranthoides]
MKGEDKQDAKEICTTLKLVATMESRSPSSTFGGRNLFLVVSPNRGLLSTGLPIDKEVVSGEEADDSKDEILKHLGLKSHKDILADNGCESIAKVAGAQQISDHPAIRLLRRNATKLLMDDAYTNPGPIQFDGPGANSRAVTLCVEDQDYMG